VAGTGMDEYAYLLTSEVLQTRPDLVVVAVFIGNDLIDQKSIRRNYYGLQNWMLIQLPQRIATLFREQNSESTFNVTNIGTDNQQDEVPAHIHDWRLEKPSLSEQAFLRFESDRLEICNTADQNNKPLFERFYRLADYIGKHAGENLLFVMIPDEFQVNDLLYQKLIKEKSEPDNYHRDLPQQQLSKYFKSRGIDYLDLLPMLRKANLQQPTYHLQDTHWNAWGNQIAGATIAEYILEHYLNHD
jgi:hypothetical protein